MCNNCDDCPQYLKSDCVIVDADKFWWESASVKSGSPRTLTEVLEGIPDCCEDMSSYIVTGDYSFSSGDENKIILLKGLDETNTSTEENPDVTYTLTLPTDETFIGKIIKIKNISPETTYGRFLWVFSEAIQYDWETGATTTSFDTLSNSIHNVLYLTYVKVSDNTYQWLVISPAIPDCTSPTETEFTDADLINGWGTFSGAPIVMSQLCNHVQLRGAITAGDASTNAFRLPVGSRPPHDMVFLGVYDGGAPYVAWINVLSTGYVQPGVYGLAGDPIDPSNAIWLNQISFYTAVSS